MYVPKKGNDRLTRKSLTGRVSPGRNQTFNGAMAESLDRQVARSPVRQVAKSPNRIN